MKQVFETLKTITLKEKLKHMLKLEDFQLLSYGKVSASIKIGDKYHQVAMTNKAAKIVRTEDFPKWKHK